MNNSVTNFIHCLSYLLRLQQPVSVTRSGGMLFVHSLLELRNELLVTLNDMVTRDLWQRIMFRQVNHFTLAWL